MTLHAQSKSRPKIQRNEDIQLVVLTFQPNIDAVTVHFPIKVVGAVFSCRNRGAAYAHLQRDRN